MQPRQLTPITIERPLIWEETYFMLLPCYFLILISWALGSSQAVATHQPNILLILADDMGYGDAGFAGSQHLITPHLDRLAQSGTYCTQAYVCSPICSPSRAGLITGRDPRRFGYQANLNQVASAYATRPELLGLPPGEHTLGNHLQAAGYRTSLIGKWHLGTGPIFHPLERGFDYFCGMLGGSHNYFPTPDEHRIEKNREPVTHFSSPYLTDFFTDEAIRWLEEPEQQHEPWFLFMSYNAPHGPLQATESDLKIFDGRIQGRRKTYAAMMHALDRSVGRLIQHLEDHQMRQNTLIVFFSDNGGATNNASWNGPLSGAKGCLREGGIRVPMIWSWPGRILSARKLDTMAVSSLDLLPTFLAAAQSKPLTLREPMTHEDAKNWREISRQFGSYDGMNLLPFLEQQAPEMSRTLFWRCQGQASVLQGTWKLIRPSHRSPQLFQPGLDQAEASDLILDEKETADGLMEALMRWESLLPTTPLWGSSPFWNGQSAKHYETIKPMPEPH